MFSLALFSLSLARSQVYTDYLVFMRRLAEEASKVAAQSGSSHVAAEHIDAAAEVSRPPSAGPLGVAVAGDARAIRGRLTDPAYASSLYSQRVLPEFRG